MRLGSSRRGSPGAEEQGQLRGPALMGRGPQLLSEPQVLISKMLGLDKDGDFAGFALNPQ